MRLMNDSMRETEKMSGREQMRVQGEKGRNGGLPHHFCHLVGGLVTSADHRPHQQDQNGIAGHTTAKLLAKPRSTK